MVNTYHWLMHQDPSSGAWDTLYQGWETWRVLAITEERKYRNENIGEFTITDEPGAHWQPFHFLVMRGGTNDYGDVTPPQPTSSPGSGSHGGAIMLGVAAVAAVGLVFVAVSR